MESKDVEVNETQAAAECGVTHAACDYNPKGSCSYEDGHGGGHKCSSCWQNF